MISDSRVESVSHCRTQRQSTVSTSTTEAELKGVSWAAKLLLAICNVVRDVMGRVGVHVRERVVTTQQQTLQHAKTETYARYVIYH